MQVKRQPIRIQPDLIQVIGGVRSAGDRGFKLWRVVEQERVALTRARPRYLRGAVSAGPDLEPQPGDHTDSILTVRCGERSAGERGLARLHRDAVSP